MDPVGTPTRDVAALGRAADSILGVVWQMPEILTGYEGLDLSPAVASMAGRAACLGEVAPDVVGALFVPMNPFVVTRMVTKARAVVGCATLLDARLDAARRYLTEIADDLRPDVEAVLPQLEQAVAAAEAAGHPVFAALRALPLPTDSLGRLWRVCDMIRERRGDSHRNAWVAVGLGPCDIAVLTEVWRGVPIGRVSTQQLGWRDGDIAAALARLGRRGYVDGEVITAAGAEQRQLIEDVTDAQEVDLVETSSPTTTLPVLEALASRVREHSPFTW